jgi:hypothetical protein
MGLNWAKYFSLTEVIGGRPYQFFYILHGKIFLDPILIFNSFNKARKNLAQ